MECFSQNYDLLFWLFGPIDVRYSVIIFGRFSQTNLMLHHISQHLIETFFIIQSFFAFTNFEKGPLNCRVIGPFLAWFTGPFRCHFCITCHNKKMYSIKSQPLAVLKLFLWAYHICKKSLKKSCFLIPKQKNTDTKILLSSFKIKISPQILNTYRRQESNLSFTAKTLRTHIH